MGYNNKLKQAMSGMKLGINNEVNLDAKKAALHLMAGGPSKINPPNTHPSNPMQKAATKKPEPKKYRTHDFRRNTTNDFRPSATRN